MSVLGVGMYVGDVCEVWDGGSCVLDFGEEQSTVIRNTEVEAQVHGWGTGEPDLAWADQGWP